MSGPVFGHLRPDLINRLVQAISNLVWSKQAVLDLFSNAGVPYELIQDFQDQVRKDKETVKKPIMARTILERMNAAGDAPNAIRMRREIVRRVVQWKDYSTCPPNGEPAARGYVAAVKEVVDMYDFMTELRQDRDRVVAENMRKVEAERQETARKAEEGRAIADEFAACFVMTDHQERGRRIETVFNRMFVHAELAARAPFTIRSETGKPLEQIDGSIELDRFVYLIEIKWWDEKVDQKEVGAFLSKVWLRHETQVRGIVISASGYTEGAITTAKEAFGKGRPIMLMAIKEFFDQFQKKGNAKELIIERLRVMADEKRVTP